MGRSWVEWAIRRAKDKRGRWAIPGRVALIAPKAVLPPGFVLPSTAPIPENPQAVVDALR